MDATELAFAGLARQAELLRERATSSRELVEAQLDRIARVDPLINAFRIVLAERALTEADQADARLAAGDERPLLGVPIAIKDGWDLAGELTTHGTGAFGAPAVEDSEFVRRLREAGAVVVGKTCQPELALWMFTETATWGVTRNPWNTDHVPGGSSGGSAAAVAAGLVAAASASDGAGSIRIPAAACGLYGLKPQRGRVPLSPFVDHWHGLSVAGTVTRSVADTALWLDVVSGPAQSDPNALPAPSEPLVTAAARAPEPLRVAMSFASPGRAPVADEIRLAVEDTAALLRSLGHTVTETDPDYGSRAGGLYSDIGSSLLVRFVRGAYDDARALPHPERLMRQTKGVTRLGALVPPSVVARERRREAEVAGRINAIFDDHDILLTPTISAMPDPVGRYEGRGAWACILGGLRGFGAPFTGHWNATGQPAASLPAGFGSDGLPLAVQLVGRTGDEATLLSLSAQIEAERPWADRRPAIA